MNWLKRFTLCLPGHRWTKIAYPRSPEGESTGTFLRCLRCGLEDHDAGSVARGAGGMV
jgi:hypothetical protein